MKINWSEPGVPVSAFAHAALLVAGLVAFASTKPFADAEESIAVEVVTVDQLNAMTKGERSAKEVRKDPKPRVDQLAEVEVQKPTQGTDKTDVPTPPARAAELADPTPAPPLPPVRPPDPVKPEPKPLPVKAAAPPPSPPQKPEPPKEEAQVPLPPQRPEPQKQDLAVPLPPPRPLPPKPDKKPPDPKEVVEKPKPQPQFDPVALAKLLEEKKKADKPKPPAREIGEPVFNAAAIRQQLLSHDRPQATGSTGRDIQRVAALGTQAGSAAKLSPSMRDALIGILQDQLYKCLSVPPGAETAKGAMPRVRVVFNADGSLGARPQLMNPSADPGSRALSDATLRAIARCSPYRIPAQFAPFFDDWRDTIFEVNPRDIVG